MGLTPTRMQLKRHGFSKRPARKAFFFQVDHRSAPRGGATAPPGRKHVKRSAILHCVGGVIEEYRVVVGGGGCDGGRKGGG